MTPALLPPPQTQTRFALGYEMNVGVCPLSSSLHPIPLSTLPFVGGIPLPSLIHEGKRGTPHSSLARRNKEEEGLLLPSSPIPRFASLP